MQSASNPTHIKFGRFELLPTEHQLLVDGEAAAIGHRAFDVLVALAERAGQLVSKNELLDLVWPGLSVVETNLAVAVSALRKILGPTVIVTIPGRGYRFSAALETLHPKPTPESVLQGDPASEAPSETRSSPDASPKPHPIGKGVPPRLSKMVGRKHEVDLLRTLLQGNRLVSIVGGGGIGKTCLAHAVAQLSIDQQRDGVVWIELAALTEPNMIPGAVAHALEMTLAPNRPPIESLMELLAPLSLLIVLDNAEHLHQGVAHFATTLAAAAAGVRFLVTSQVRLNLPQEKLVRLAGLTLPDQDMNACEALEYDAVALFVSHVQALERRFSVTDENVNCIANICRRLDGIPLALGLAAARVPVLGLQTLSTLLDERFRLLTLGSPQAPTRHQTLLAAFDWSYALLSPEAQALFRRLSVLVGGFTLQELAPVAGLDDDLDEWDLIDLLADLVERSLITVDAQATPRYGFLESAHKFAQGKLKDSDEEDTIHRRHLKYFHDRVEQAEHDYMTANWTNKKDWLQINYANIRAALHWSVECNNDIESGAQMVAVLNTLWYERAQVQEQEHWLPAVLARREHLSPMLTADLLFGLAVKCFEVGDCVEAEVLFRESLALFTAQAETHPQLAYVYVALGVVCGQRSGFEEAIHFNQLALEENRRRGDRKPEATILHNQGRCQFHMGQFAQAEANLRAAAKISLEMQDTGTLASHWITLSECLLEMGQIEAGLKVAQEALAMQRTVNAGYQLGVSLTALARIELARGNIGGAASHLSESLQVLERAKHPLSIALCLHYWAELALAVNQPEVSAQLSGFSVAFCAENKVPLSPTRSAHFAATLAALKSTLGDARCDEELARGAAHSIGEAVALTTDLASASPALSGT